MSDPVLSDAPDRRLAFLPTIVSAFAAVAVMWAAWFCTHLPGVDLPPPLIAGIILALLIAAIAWMGRLGGGNWRSGIGAGILAGLVNLILLGSMLTEAGQGTPAPSENIDPSLKPGAPLIAGGFLLACAVCGAIGGWLGGRIAKKHPDSSAQAWLARFGWVAALATGELILVGGLVTSSESGLAVPDWPGTYGANMFLYPVALMTEHRIFLEHSHRLFGSMVGLTTMALGLCVIARDRRTWTRVMAGILMALVIVQGVLGGLRVTEQSAALGVVHGVLAQIFFALLVAQAVWLSPAWIALPRTTHPELRKLRMFSTAATHTVIVQLIFGALFRHLPNGSHALWTHVGFSAVVVVMVVLCATGCVSLEHAQDAHRRRMRRIGRALFGVVGLQFALGVIALILVMRGADRGPVPTAERLSQAEDVPIAEILAATAHQANGALLLALVTSAQVWSKRACARRRGEDDTGTAQQARPSVSSE